jgi:hypothetical protein
MSPVPCHFTSIGAHSVSFCSFAARLVHLPLPFHLHWYLFRLVLLLLPPLVPVPSCSAPFPLPLVSFIFPCPFTSIGHYSVSFCSCCLVLSSSRFVPLLLSFHLHWYLFRLVLFLMPCHLPSLTPISVSTPSRPSRRHLASVTTNTLTPPLDPLRIVTRVSFSN